MNHFIKLPDGTILNLAHVKWVNKTESWYNTDGKRVPRIEIDGVILDDPQGKIRAYFEKLAEVI